MKKLFLIFTVLFTSISPIAGFGALNDFDANFQEFQTRQQQQFQGFQARQQQQHNDFQSRTQQEIAQFRKRSDDKIAEIKRKSAEAFEKLEKEYNDFIQGTPFVNCIPSWSFLECKQDEPAWWSCNLKPGITRSQMQSDVEAYCTQKSNAFEYDPLEDFEEPENEENDTPIRMTGQTEELSPEDEVNAHDEYDPSQDSQGAPYATQQNNSWNTNYNDSDETPASTPAPTPNKSASAMIAQDATRKAEKNKKNCTLAQRNKINATNCKISPDGKYSDIECKNGYTKNADGTKCEKSDTPNKKAKTELIKISGIVIDETSKDEQTIGGVRIKYDEGKKDKDGNKKYAQHQTGNNGRFAINIVPGSTITFTHKMYKETTKSYSAEIKDVKIQMSPTAETTNNTNLQALCEKDKKGTWNKTSGKCNCKDKSATFDKSKGCTPAESLQFNGFVIDETGEPMPDVKVKYGNQSTKTDAQGKFTLNAPKNTEIVFSHKGYKNQTHTLTESYNDIDISMEPTDKAANNAEKQKLCEKDGKGEWKPKLNKCNCKDKKAFFDETDGCTTATTEYTNAESALETLYEQFKTQLETIQAQNNE